MIEIFVEWGNRLSTNRLGGVIERAIAQNEWFTATEINLAIDAIVGQMLQKTSLAQWFRGYNLPAKIQQNTLVIMAGNIPLVGFFDLMCVVAAGHTALIKPSHKDRELIEWVISELHAIDPTIPIYIYDGQQRVDRLIATGNEVTRRHFESAYPHTPTLLRGTRHSLAIIAQESDSELLPLGEDIFSYSGLGCRNVSLIFVPREFDIARLPKRETHPKHRNNYLRIRAILTMQGVNFHDSGSLCISESKSFPREISELNIYRYDSPEEYTSWIEEHDSDIQCIVANSHTIQHPRRVAIGSAQHPSLFDYADGIDTMAFLLNEELK